MNVKKLSARLFAVCVSLCLAFGLLFAVACKSDDGNYSETFIGELSEDGYADKDEAAGAFIENELNGLKFQAEFVSYEAGETLTDEQVEALDIPADLQDKVVSVESGTVSYRLSDTGEAALASADTAEYNISIYIVVISPSGTQVYEYHYYVPPMETGNGLTKSYFESVFEVEKYKNCVITENVTATTMGMSSKITSSMTIADDKILLTQHSETPMEEPTDVSGYFEKTLTGMDVWVSNDGGETWTKDNYGYMAGLGYDSIESIINSIRPGFDDFTFYVKTNKGFKVKDELMEDFCRQSFEALMSYYGSNVSNLKASCEFFVTEGVISKAVTKVSMKINAQGITMDVSSESTSTFSYGNAQVERPANIA